MARRTHVPQFGNWDANDHVPYTVVFDKARQGRGQPINPNDPSDNPSMFPAGRGNGAPGRRSYNPNDPEDSTEGPDPQPQGSSRPPPRRSAGPAAQPSRGPVADPKRTSRETTRRTSVSGDDGQMHGQAIPSRARPRTTAGGGDFNKQEAPIGLSAAHTPQFGGWDTENPAAGAYTLMFNKVRDEKKKGEPVSVHRPRGPNNGDLYGPSRGGKAHGAKNSWLCCFGSEP